MSSVAFLLLVAVVPAVLACSNYEFTIGKLEACNPNSVLRFAPGLSISMQERDGKCLVVPNGCLIVSETLGTTEIKWKVKKGKTPFPGDMNFCDDVKKHEFLHIILKLFGIKASCPIEKGEYCAKSGEGYDVTSKQKLFPLLCGKYEVNVTMTHNVGDTCVAMEMSIKKLRKGAKNRG